MSYQADIHNALKSSSAIVGLTGGRIYADVCDQDAEVPYLVFQVISTRGETAHDGSRGIEFPTIQFSCWAKTKSAAVTLSAKVNSLLDGRTQTGASGISMIFSNAYGTYEADTKLFGEILEYSAATNTNT